jgi:crossover junction endodeoxyribonuclease RuvC
MSGPISTSPTRSWRPPPASRVPGTRRIRRADAAAARSPTLVILGVDPGTRSTGYGAIEAVADRARLIEHGTVTAPPRRPVEERLREIHRGISALIARLHPDILAVEDIFHAANTRTALILGHVRGVVLLAGAEAGLPIRAYSPATVKLEVTGSGRAEKEQVAYMVARHLGLEGRGEAGDAADALAVALCHAHRQRGEGAPK